MSVGSEVSYISIAYFNKEHYVLEHIYKELFIALSFTENMLFHLYQRIVIITKYEYTTWILHNHDS